MPVTKQHTQAYPPAGDVAAVPMPLTRQHIQAYHPDGDADVPSSSTPRRFSSEETVVGCATDLLRKPGQENIVHAIGVRHSPPSHAISTVLLLLLLLDLCARASVCLHTCLVTFIVRVCHVSRQLHPLFHTYRRDRRAVSVRRFTEQSLCSSFSAQHKRCRSLAFFHLHEQACMHELRALLHRVKQTAFCEATRMPLSPTAVAPRLPDRRLTPMTICACFTRCRGRET